jgi:hypothetical protein
LFVSIIYLFLSIFVSFILFIILFSFLPLIFFFFLRLTSSSSFLRSVYFWELFNHSYSVALGSCVHTQVFCLQLFHSCTRCM